MHLRDAVYIGLPVDRSQREPCLDSVSGSPRWRFGTKRGRKPWDGRVQ